MRATTTLATLFLVALSGGALAAPAQATGLWSVGADFTVGGVFFSLGYERPARYYPSYRPSYYYRTSPRFAVHGARCGSACFLDRGYAYHHPSCPLVATHFSRHRFRPDPIWLRLGWGAPRYGYGHHHDRYDHRDRWERYDRWDRRGHDDHRGRGHDRGRGRGHDGHRGCRHH